jgi:hypothetical protein
MGSPRPAAGVCVEHMPPYTIALGAQDLNDIQEKKKTFLPLVITAKVLLQCRARRQTAHQQARGLRRQPQAGAAAGQAPRGVAHTILAASGGCCIGRSTHTSICVPPLHKMDTIYFLTKYCLQLLLVRSPQGPGERQEAQGHPSRTALRSASSSSACGRRLCCRSHRKGIDSTRCMKWRGFELLCIGVMSVLQQRLGR